MKRSSTQGHEGLGRRLSAGTFALLLALVFALLGQSAFAQQLTGTISGTAYDQTGAVVPNANVVLKNEASGDERTSVTDNAGHFAITGVQPATYSLVISAKGFSTWQENAIAMGLGDNRAVPNIKLSAGGATTTVDVVSGADAVVPTDTAEISTSLNQDFISEFPLGGRDAGELLKIAPGMALNPSGGGQGGFSSRVVGSNNGPVGSYAANGTQPNGTMAYMLDGGNLVDPGNMGTQIANINPDMVANIKVLMSNYGAEYAKGPVIFEAFSKSGGQKFHGEGYFYTHNSALNSVDAYTKSQGGNNKAESYYYMGGNVGGPVILPFLKFNRNRDKLFFWVGYEYMKQQPAGSILNYNVPTARQLVGDFSNPEAPVGSPAQQAWPNFYSQLTANVPTGGSATGFSPSSFDPNIPGILKLYPAANQTPSSANGYTNYQYVNTSPQNRWEGTGKLDYALSDNDKLTGSYTLQKENDLAPISIWWAPGWTLPYPSPAASKTTTYVILTNYTHVFNPTTTNEFVFSWSHFVNPYSLANPSAVSRKTNGFNVQGLFGHTTDQIPNFEGPWGGTLANISNYPFTPGTFGGVKQVPAFYDNFTKVIGNHTAKVGFYWDKNENFQNSNSPDNGTYNFGGSNISTNNYVADLELGNIASYQQQNYSPAQDIKFHQWSIYAQDSWKMNRKLTLNFGMRFDHLGQWYGNPAGFQVWDPTNYVNTANAPNNTGLRWAANDFTVPLSGFVSPIFYYAPRVGVAYDVFGTGKTVVRGGFASYRYQASTEVANAGNGPLNSFGYTTPTAFKGYANASTFTPPSSVAQNGSSVYAMQRGDNRVPYTNDWNVTVSQALKWRSVLEMSWVGNHSDNEYLDGSNSNLGNLNNVTPGAFFQKNPTTGVYNSPSSPSCSTTDPTGESIYCAANPTAYTPSFNANNYRPLINYQNVYLLTHAPFSNYNSLQVSFQKQSGPVTFVTNYTFSKVLGIRDGGSNNGSGNGTGVDPFNIRGNYGPLAYDHTHILNLSTNLKLPRPIHGEGLANHLLAGAVNGWAASNYTAYQSGAPLQPALGGNLNAQYPGGLTTPTVAHPNLPDNSIALPSGLRANGVSPSTWFGTNAINVLIPALTCDPTKNLAKGQRFNPNCFTTPAYGTQGPAILPYMRTPNYWDSDLAVFKSFQIRESQRVELRVSATNWLNHPLRQFGLANQSDEQLNFTKTTNATCSGCVNTSQNQQTGAITVTPIQVTSLSPTNTNATTTGTPAFKTGSRFLTVSAKYFF